MEAPADVCREYICRKFGAHLNMSIGDSFVFTYLQDGGIRLLLRHKEKQTYSRDVIPFIVDRDTLVGSYKITIVPETGVPAHLIPHYEKDDE